MKKATIVLTCSVVAHLASVLILSLMQQRITNPGFEGLLIILWIINLVSLIAYLISLVYIIMNFKYKKRYGIWRFVEDAFFCLCTCGLWLIWIFVRERESDRNKKSP